MDRQQRREFFERLCVLRNGYDRRGMSDTTSVITIEAMIERAIWLLDRPRANVVVVTEDGSQVA